MHWRDRLMRRPATNEPGHAHELTFTCFQRIDFLQTDCYSQWLADAIDAARVRLNFQLWAYVFMPEHVHLIVWPRLPLYNVSEILKAIKEPVARKAVRHMSKNAPEALERITVKRGLRIERRFWQAGGGFDRNVNEPAILWAMIEYIHANPVRRGLVNQANVWKWSSAEWHEGKNSLRPDNVDIGGLDRTRNG
jgi:putative transposase